MLAGLARRFPDAEIDWVVQSKAADLLRGHPRDRAAVGGPVPQLAPGADPRRVDASRRRMRERGYDLVLDFQGMIKGAVWALVASGPGVRVGWGPGHAQNLAWLWYHGVRPPPGRRVNRHLRHRALVDWLAVPDLPGEAPPIDAAEAAAVDAFLEGLVAAPRPWIVGLPGIEPDRQPQAVGPGAARGRGGGDTRPHGRNRARGMGSGRGGGGAGAGGRSARRSRDPGDVDPPALRLLSAL